LHSLSVSRVIDYRHAIRTGRRYASCRHFAEGNVQDVSRRAFLLNATVLGGMAMAPRARTQAERSSVAQTQLPPYGNNTLPSGVRPRLVPNVNGLTVNMLEAGTAGQPLVLLIHGFPNLGYSWRKVMPAFASAGYYVIAPDCRGFGRTAGWDNSWDADPAPFLVLNMVRDQIALLYALGYRRAEMVVGHDQGEHIAVYAAIVRPDMFLRLTTISASGGGPPSFPFSGSQRPPAYSAAELDAEYAKLNPPRRGYQDYWASREADDDMKHVAQGMSQFFRAFYYTKGGEFPQNQNLMPLRPMPTAREAAAENARMPEYYVMRRDRSMPATMAAHMPSTEYIRNCKWFTDAECGVYGQEYSASGWTGALHEYRHRRNNGFPATLAEQRTFSGRTIDVPAQFIAGKQDWGANRIPGGPLQAGRNGYTNFKGVQLVDHAGHWPHEEQPEIVSQQLIGFLKST
jgi:pimeloyl-ACP methyl ester carboxylesterase